MICTFIRPLLISESRKGYTLRLLLMCLEALEEGFSCFPGRAVLENLNIKSKFNHSFTNRHCLHSAILKTCKARDMQFFLQNVQNEIYSRFWGMFKCNMEFNREACWINSKISNRDQNTTLMIFLFCRYCWSVLWCNYWRFLMLWNFLKLLKVDCSNTACSLSMRSIFYK